MLLVLLQDAQNLGPPSPDTTFRDILDVAGVAIPLALAVLLVAVSWPNLKRWVRHRIRRRRRRRHHHHNAHPGAPTTP